jgi:transcriptional antiterminator Rof (Rho-off)
MSDYHPIDCDLHSELEWLILRKQPVVIRWQDPDRGPQITDAMLQDLVTQEGAEWLIARNEFAPLRLRLDWLDQVGKVNMRASKSA